MIRRPIDAPNAPAPEGGYAQAVECVGPGRRLYVSGQIPVDIDGRAPAGFDDQAALVWDNIAAQLAAAGMGLEHLVKVTTYLSARRYAAANSAARARALGAHRPALTVIIAEIYDPAWLLEIEAVAEA